MEKFGSKFQQLLFTIILVLACREFLLLVYIDEWRMIWDILNIHKSHPRVLYMSLL